MRITSAKNRRGFIKDSLALGSGAFLYPTLMTSALNCSSLESGSEVEICAHLWVYASKFPPNWDCTPVLETVFSDLSQAGIQGLELMEANLRHDNAVSRLRELIDKYELPVSGSSYGVGFKMWDAAQHKEILKDLEIVIPRLKEVGGSTFGISVGSADHVKTEEELDAQAALLSKVRTLCTDNGIQANLHNHTYEVENEMHDLRGTLLRIPDFNLGPDLNWLIRGGVDPVSFIEEFGTQIVYLHIRDEYENGVWTEYVGQGDMDFPAMSNALKKVGFKGKAAIELAFPNEFSPEFSLREDWKKSKDYIKETFDW